MPNATSAKTHANSHAFLDVLELPDVAIVPARSGSILRGVRHRVRAGRGRLVPRESPEVARRRLTTPAPEQRKGANGRLELGERRLGFDA